MANFAEDEAIRELLCCLAGVSGAQLERCESGEISEIHILADDSRSPKQIVRDVLSALAAKFSLKVDHKIISVAQVLSCTRGEAVRLRYTGMDASYAGSGCRFKVRLSDGEREYAGEADGGTARLARYRALARATAAAINEYLGERGAVTCEDVKLAELHGESAVISEVVFRSGGGEEVFVGSCVERDDGGLSAIRATLDSVNRRLSRV